MDKETFKKHLGIEEISNLFFSVAEERYPASEKVLQLVSRLVDPIAPDIYERINIKISVLGAIRNMIKEVSPLRIYRTLQHREDLLAAVLDALENLEDELEEFEEGFEDEETGI
jgi:type III secretion protein W